LKIHVNGKFSNKDARYLLGCGIATPNVTKGDQHEYWARIQGILPRTPGSLYQAPLVANHSGMWSHKQSSSCASKRAGGIV
jgi:hypothetical protein